MTPRIFPALLWLLMIVLAVPANSLMARSIAEWNDQFENQNPREILELLFAAKDEWPMIEHLSVSDGAARDNAKLLTTSILDALRKEAEKVSLNTTAEELIRLTELTLSVARESRTKGGYLNDLISASAENVLILTAWHILSEKPEKVDELKRRAFGKSDSEISAKSWFEKRIELDPWLLGNRDRLLKLTEETGGFQAGNFLGMDREYPEMVRPTVFEMIESPDVITLWWEIFLNDFELAAVLPAAIEYTIQGGQLSPRPINMIDAVEDVFGAGGLPFSHQLRTGRIDPEDMWRSMELSINADKRSVNQKAWFGD